MVKDRLVEFCQKSAHLSQNAYADQIDGNMSDFNKHLATKDDATTINIEMDWINEEITRFLQQVQNLREKAIALKADIEEVKVLQKQILASAARDQGKVDKLESIVQDVKLKSKRLMAELQAMEKDNLETIEKMQKSPKGSLPRIRKFQYKALLKTFNELLDQYQSVQLEYQEKCRARLENLMKIKTGNLDDIDGAVQKLLDGDDEEWVDTSLFTDGYQLQTEKAKQDLVLANARLHDLRKIESALKDLHDIFMEMSGLVADQGEQIDSIEKSVEEAKDFVDSGVDQLDSAQKLQKKARKNKIRIIIILTILAIILCLLIYFSF